MGIGLKKFFPVCYSGQRPGMFCTGKYKKETGTKSAGKLTKHRIEILVTQ